MPESIGQRVRALDWEAIRASLDERGHAVTPPLLTSRECAGLRAVYADAGRFRAAIEMERHRFGRGQYRYFSRPLPRTVLELRRAAYPPLAAIANAWARRISGFSTYPARLGEFLEVCHRKGQARPTPLLLRYETGGYNCLHRDLYGEIAFPLQLTIFLSRPGSDYDGGAFLLVEQRPRQQSIGDALLPERGAAVVFATAERPVAGNRGFFCASMRHGVARVTRGSRYTLGVIFHDAR